MNEEQSELYERRRDIAEKISNFFGGEEPDYNDQGYQDLLAELDEVNVLLSELDGIELDDLN